MNMKILILNLLWVYFWMNPVYTAEEDTARDYMKKLNEQAAQTRNEISNAIWNYETNITNETLAMQERIVHDAHEKLRAAWLQTIKFDWKSFGDYDLRRQFKLYSKLGDIALSSEKYTKYRKIIGEMTAIIASTARISAYKDNIKCDLALDPDLTTLMKTSSDPKELEHKWVERMKKVAVVRPLYAALVDLANEAARSCNFTNNAENWLSNYEDSTFKSKIEAIWEQLKPFYLQLHAYIRFKFREKFGDMVSKKGPIPEHLMEYIQLNFMLPYPQAADVNITKAFVDKGYTPKKMFEAAEDFYVSLNLSSMTPEFWNNSIIEQPKDGRKLLCYPSTTDCSNGRDFRIKMCTKISYNDFITIHHEMGHIQYFMQYKDLPAVYRDSANDGFTEAVGDTIALSVSTLKHLKKVGLIGEEVPENEQTELNNLFKIAQEKIALLPMAYLIDLWRWDIFEGKTTSKFYNCKWWYYKKNIQGVGPPVKRSENDFDAGYILHVVQNVPYLRYFIAYIIQFQFHQAACEKAGEYDPNDPSKPLHKCDIYKNKKAGNAIGDMLQMGASRPWPEAMEKLTGQRNMNVSGFFEYFKPLQKWLEAENEKNKAFVGWRAYRDTCKPTGKRGRSSACKQFIIKAFTLYILGYLWYI